VLLLHRMPHAGHRQAGDCGPQLHDRPGHVAMVCMDDSRLCP
jgi:hypothetical protein